MSDRIASVTAIDTSVIVPGLLFWHEKHEAASAALVQLLESGNEVILPLHSLVEAYAVMTRLPPPHRLSAKDALDLLDGSFRNRSNLIGLEGDEGWDLLQNLSRRRRRSCTGSRGARTPPHWRGSSPARHVLVGRRDAGGPRERGKSAGCLVLCKQNACGSIQLCRLSRFAKSHPK